MVGHTNGRLGTLGDAMRLCWHGCGNALPLTTALCALAPAACLYHHHLPPSLATLPYRSTSRSMLQHLLVHRLACTVCQPAHAPRPFCGAYGLRAPRLLLRCAPRRHLRATYTTYRHLLPYFRTRLLPLYRFATSLRNFHTALRVGIPPLTFSYRTPAPDSPT